MPLSRVRVVVGASILALAALTAMIPLPAQAQRRIVVVEEESTTSWPPPPHPLEGLYQGRTAEGQLLAIELGSSRRSSVFLSAVREAVADAHGDWHADGERIEIAIGEARHVLRFSPALEVQAGGHSGTRPVLVGESSEGGAWSVAGQRFVEWERASGEVASDPAAIARALLAELDSTAFGADFAGWRAQHADLGCREYLSNGYLSDTPEEEWCYACTRRLAGIESRRMFYAHAGARACALERLELQITTDEPDTARRARDIVAEKLRAQLGEPAPDESRVAPGSGSWLDTRVWNRAGRKIYLFLDGDRAGAPLERVGILVRDRPLAELQASRTDFDLNYPRDVVREPLASALAGAWPALASALRENPKRSVVAQAIAEALDAAPDASPELQAPLLLAADVLASELPRGAERAELAAFDLERRGVSFEETHYGFILGEPARARRVLDENARPWADLALVWLHGQLYAGTPICEADPDQFRNVITANEAALRKHPDSRFRAWLLFDLDRAYETWWSLSRRGPESSGGGPQYVDGADTARQRALDAYRQVTALVPDTLAARYAAERIPRLDLGITTNSREFYCMSEC